MKLFVGNENEFNGRKMEIKIKWKSHATEEYHIKYANAKARDESVAVTHLLHRHLSKEIIVVYCLDKYVFLLQKYIVIGINLHFIKSHLGILFIHRRITFIIARADRFQKNLYDLIFHKINFNPFFPSSQIVFTRR